MWLVSVLLGLTIFSSVGFSENIQYPAASEQTQYPAFNDKIVTFEMSDGTKCNGAWVNHDGMTFLVTVAHGTGESIFLKDGTESLAVIKTGSSSQKEDLALVIFPSSVTPTTGTVLGQDSMSEYDAVTIVTQRGTFTETVLYQSSIFLGTTNGQAKLREGDSGSPAYNYKGELIGVLRGVSNPDKVLGNEDDNAGFLSLHSGSPLTNKLIAELKRHAQQGQATSNQSGAQGRTSDQSQQHARTMQEHLKWVEDYKRAVEGYKNGSSSGQLKLPTYPGTGRPSDNNNHRANNSQRRGNRSTRGHRASRYSYKCTQGCKVQYADQYGNTSNDKSDEWYHREHSVTTRLLATSAADAASKASGTLRDYCDEHCTMPRRISCNVVGTPSCMRN